MKRYYLLGFLILVVFDTFSQVSFKFAGESALPFTWDLAWVGRVMACPWTYGAIAGYVSAFFTWMTILKHVAVGPSFAASHLELVSVTLVSVWLFDEPLNAHKIIGGLSILMGVFCLAKGEAQIEHDEAEARNASAP